MKMLCPASSTLDHATIAARIDFRDIDEDRIHDILNGYRDIPTQPEPVRLQLTEAERANVWHSIASCTLASARRTGDEAAISRGMRGLFRTEALCAYENLREQLGDLDDGRCLDFVESELLRKEFRVIDSVGTVVARVSARDEPDAIRRMITAYDAGVEAGRSEARAAMRSALGL